MPDQVLNLRIKITDDGTVKVLDNVEREVDRLDRTVGRSGASLESTFLKIGSAIAAAFAVDRLVRFGAELVRLAGVQEEAERRLEAVLRATGGAAGYSADELKRMAAELQDALGVGDEAILGTMAKLATFRNVSGETFREAVELAHDMAFVMETDVRSAAVQLGKALNDPIQGMTALTRVGVSFTEQQKEQVRALQESGDLMGAQNVILAELRQEFGGVSRAMDGTWKRAATNLASAWGDLKEKIGDIVTKDPGTIRFLQELTEAVKDLQTAMEGFQPTLHRWMENLATSLRRNPLSDLLMEAEDLERTIARIEGPVWQRSFADFFVSDENLAGMKARLAEVRRMLAVEFEKIEPWYPMGAPKAPKREQPGKHAGAPGGAPVPLWTDPTESAERWGEIWARKAWEARARVMEQLAKSAPPAVVWIDPVEGAGRWGRLVEEQARKVAALTDNATTNPLRRLKEVTEQDRRVIDEITEHVRKNAMRRAEAEKTWLTGARDGLREYAADALKTYDEVAQAVEGAFAAMEDALVRFVRSGKLSFREFADAVIDDMARIAIRAQITGPLAQIVGGWFGAPGASPAPVPATASPAGPSIGGYGWWSTPAPRLAPRVAAGAAAAGPVQVTVINQSGVPVDVRERPGSMGREVEIWIGRTVAGDIDRGGDVAQAIQRVFGLTRRGY